MANDLDRIQRMIEGEQRLAAIDKIDALLQKHPQNGAHLLLDFARQYAADKGLDDETRTGCVKSLGQTTYTVSGS